MLEWGNTSFPDKLLISQYVTDFPISPYTQNPLIKSYSENTAEKSFIELYRENTLHHTLHKTSS